MSTPYQMPIIMPARTPYQVPIRHPPNAHMRICLYTTLQILTIKCQMLTPYQMPIRHVTLQMFTPYQISIRPPTHHTKYLYVPLQMPTPYQIPIRPPPNAHTLPCIILCLPLLTMHEDSLIFEGLGNTEKDVIEYYL